MGLAGATGGRVDVLPDELTLDGAPTDSVRALGNSEPAVKLCSVFKGAVDGDDIVLSLDFSLVHGFNSSLSTFSTLSWTSFFSAPRPAMPGITTPLDPKIGCGAALISCTDR
jgi:hypothetical protein